jgi:hypothetical protein
VQARCLIQMTQRCYDMAASCPGVRTHAWRVALIDVISCDEAVPRGLVQFVGGVA